MLAHLRHGDRHQALLGRAEGDNAAAQVHQVRDASVHYRVARPQCLDYGDTRHDLCIRLGDCTCQGDRRGGAQVYGNGQERKEYFFAVMTISLRGEHQY
jgi:hypothetical protein